jgi:hypothetical protein
MSQAKIDVHVHYLPEVSSDALVAAAQTQTRWHPPAAAIELARAVHDAVLNEHDQRESNQRT